MQACPPSAGYRLRKFARRHKRPVRRDGRVRRPAGRRRGRQHLAGGAGDAWPRPTGPEHGETPGGSGDKDAARPASGREGTRGRGSRHRRAVNDFLQIDLLAEAAPERTPHQEGDGGSTAGACGGPHRRQVRPATADRGGDPADHRRRLSRLGDYQAAPAAPGTRPGPSPPKLGEEHPDTLNSMNNLALLVQGQGQLAKAQPVYHRGPRSPPPRSGGGAPRHDQLHGQPGGAVPDSGPSSPRPSRSSSEPWKSAARALGGITPTVPITAMNNLGSMYKTRAVSPRPSRSSSRPWKSAAATRGKHTPRRCEPCKTWRTCTGRPRDSTAPSRCSKKPCFEECESSGPTTRTRCPRRSSWA